MSVTDNEKGQGWGKTKGCAIGQVRHPKERAYMFRAWAWLMYQPGYLQQWKPIPGS